MASNSKEIWKQITSLKGKTTINYGISDLGNLCTFEKSLNDKVILKLGENSGFPTVSIRINNKSKALFSHREVATYFIKKPSPKHKFVLHLDHDKANNNISNLKWATQKEQSAHNKFNPVVMKAISQRVYTGATAKKLNEAKVLKLKTELWNPKRKITLKQLADKYGIAEMNLYRIKSGLFWYHVHVEGEPVTEKYKEFLKNIEANKKQVVIDEALLIKKTKLKEAEKKAKELLKIKAKKEKALTQIKIKKEKEIVRNNAKKEKEILRLRAKKEKELERIKTKKEKELTQITAKKEKELAKKIKLDETLKKAALLKKEKLEKKIKKAILEKIKKANKKKTELLKNKKKTELLKNKKKTELLKNKKKTELLKNKKKTELLKNKKKTSSNKSKTKKVKKKVKEVKKKKKNK